MQAPAARSSAPSCRGRTPSPPRFLKRPNLALLRMSASSSRCIRSPRMLSQRFPARVFACLRSSSARLSPSLSRAHLFRKHLSRPSRSQWPLPGKSRSQLQRSQPQRSQPYLYRKSRSQSHRFQPYPCRKSRSQSHRLQRHPCRKSRSQPHPFQPQVRCPHLLRSLLLLRLLLLRLLPRRRRSCRTPRPSPWSHSRPSSLLPGLRRR